MSEEKELKAAAESIESILKMVTPDITELERELLSDDDLRNRANDVEIFYRMHFKKALSLIVYKQLKNSAVADTSGTVMFWKGALFGLQEIEDWFEKAVNLSKSRFDKKEDESEPGNPLSLIT